ncbi:biotin--[acetyl-CoA-carboxylase] ligase [Arcticibacterium luteifluviistationis]|uniref:Biotin--[acetyl-CoA-carboxylase] ligase n=1 Tax=Arcticibacterium luteifluviistationis TaxID=1784714 RepID=A0A2Z4GCT1_9BACT|nr:biotin--[acetyl-CoA-carboxylase] ligase [Arcticibacterium luteifluviistationis]AWV98971.1 biotin--[acetyl-CoA-carboxylase] ligase [Arcticibacterium luteifluviistationis]
MNKIQPKTLFTGKNAIYLPTCHSTNETAGEIIQKGEIMEGTIVITDNQTRGKGQRGNTWHSEKGQNLTFTLILKPDFIPVNEQFRLNMAVSLAVYQTLTEFLDEKLKIKWPNDILYGDQKLGGILIESLISNRIINYSFIGIGLNINQGNFELPNATSLSNLTENGLYDREELLTSLLENLEKQYLSIKQGKDVFLKDNYTENLFRRDVWSEYKTEDGVFEGKIRGVSESGKLIMETKFGLKQFGTKEFEYIY